MIKITKEQKRILYLSGMVLLFFIIFLIFIFRPQNRQSSALKKELDNIQNQIAEIMRLTQGEDLTEAVKKIRINFDKASGHLPEAEESIIHDLSEEANRLKIKVKNITAAGGKIQENQVAGNRIEEVSISMNLACEYRQLGEYLNTLRNNFPVLIRVKQLDIGGPGEGKSELEIALEILAYVSKRN